VQYNYDLNNQLRQVVQLNHPDPAHKTTAYGYDTNGNLTTLEDANAHTTTNAFDVFNQLNLETDARRAVTDPHLRCRRQPAERWSITTAGPRSTPTTT
jgi:YD repeat-containing protein